MRYLLVGNYGVGNVGDEALRDYFLRRFPEMQWRVVSAQPPQNALPRFPGGGRSLIRCQWVRTVSALRTADGIVFGGGSLFTDAESVRACFLWSVPALVAWLFRKPVFLAFQGVGPFHTRVGEALARWVVAHASFISVRDEASFRRITGEWKKNTEVIQSFDPSLMLFDEQKYITRSKNLLIFIPRVSTGWSAENKEKVLVLLKRWVREQGSVRIVALHPTDAHERTLCQSFASPLGVTPDEPASLRVLSSLFDDAACIITQRYHGAIAALACGVPFLALSEAPGDKLDAVAGLCGCPSETIGTLSEAAVLQTVWEEKRGGLSQVRQECLTLVQAGEEALREALIRWAANISSTLPPLALLVWSYGGHVTLLCP